MKRHKKRFSLWLFLIGILILVVPQVRILYNEVKIERGLEKYQAAETLTTEADYAAIQKVGLKVGLKEEKEEAEKGEPAFLEKEVSFSDPFTYDVAPPEYSDESGDPVFGYIDIPKIGARLPLYVGATDYHLSLGAAQVSGTSLPLGGLSTHSLISAHRGYAGANFFRYIDLLVPGDRLTIHAFNQVLTYEVTGSAVVVPEDSSSISIREGEDLLTLLSCHPYRVNDKRILVYTKRVEAEKGTTIIPEKTEKKPMVLSSAKENEAPETAAPIPTETQKSNFAVSEMKKSELELVVKEIVKFSRPELEPTVRRSLFLNRTLILLGFFLMGGTIWKMAKEEK